MRSLTLWIILNYEKLRNWTKKNICSNILKTEILWCIRLILIFLNVLPNLKPKHILKGEIGQIERKEGKITCVTGSSKDPT